MKTKPVVLTLAGSDPCGGAGLQADLRVMEALGCYGMAVVTALTVQNSLGVQRVCPVEPSLVEEQAFALFDDIRPDAVKVGMLGNGAVAEAVAHVLQRYGKGNVVVDTILKSTSGASLFDSAAEGGMIEVMKCARVITPNLPEACNLLNDSMPTLEALACKMSLMAGGASVYLKGGHGDGETLTDLFYNAEAGHFIQMQHSRIATRNTHGTGCTLSSALASYLATGCTLDDAARQAADFMQRALSEGCDYTLGQGHGPAFMG